MADEKAPWEQEEKAPWEMTEDEYEYGSDQDIPGVDNAAKGMGEALEFAGKVIDYPLGFIRTGVASLANNERNHVVNPSDWKKAREGMAPRLKEYLERAYPNVKARLSDVVPGYADPFTEEGAPWYQPEKGGPLDITATGFAGFAGETAMDPSAWGPLLAKRMPGAKLREALKAVSRPTGAVGEVAGKTMYRKGLKEMDHVAKMSKKGDHAFSDVMWDRDIYGTNGMIANKATDAMYELYERREQIIQAAKQLGVKIDSFESLDDAMNYAARLRLDPNTREAGEALDDLILEYWQTGPDKKGVVDPELATQFKTSNSKSAGDGSYKKHAKPNPDDVGHKQIARGYKIAIEDQVDDAARNIPNAPFKEGELRNVNEELGILLDTAKTLDNEAIKGQRKNFVTSIDAILGGGALMSADPREYAQKMILLKKAADLAKTTGARTTLGIGLKKLNRSEALYPLLKQRLNERLNTKAPEEVPWGLLTEEEDETPPWEE
jgi:hypothetical protein